MRTEEVALGLQNMLINTQESLRKKVERLYDPEEVGDYKERASSRHRKTVAPMNPQQ